MILLYWKPLTYFIYLWNSFYFKILCHFDVPSIYIIKGVYMIDMILHSSISFCGIYLERRVDDHFINRLNCQQQILVSFAFISNFLSYTQTSHYTIIVGKPLPLYYCSTFCDCRMWLIWTDFGTLNITSVSRMSTGLMVYHNFMQLTAGHQAKDENIICIMLKYI